MAEYGLLSRYLCRSLFGMLALLLQEAEPVFAEHPCSRIVSLAPSLTETAYALGLGEQVIAVSRYDSFPPEVKDKLRVGGLYDVNIETLVHLSSSPVLLLREHASFAEQLQKLSIPVLTVDHRSLSGIVDSVRTIGSYCAAPDWQAQHENFSNGLQRWSNFFRTRTPVDVLVILGGVEKTGSGQDFYVSGADGFYAEAIEITGGKNIHSGPTGLLPAVSIEQIVSADPEVIIEIRPDGSVSSGVARGSLIATLFPRMSAIKSGRVHIISASYASIPGPRFPLLLKDLARILHPEIPEQQLPTFAGD